MQNIKSFLANLSPRPGIYQMLGEKGEILYVGKAKNLKKRVASYFSSRAKDLKTLSLVKHIKDINVTVTNSETEAVLLECNLIKQYRPRYNVLLRDDKSYPYILITTQHPYPRIDLYRGPRKKNALYFGPYPSAHAVRETISLLQKLFRLRTCTDSFYNARTRPCMLYQIGRCTGPCVGLISQEEYAENVHLAVLFLEGKSTEIIHELEKRMEIAAQTLDFERAAQYRDQISRLRHIQERQYVSAAEGEADVIGCASHAGLICIQLFSIRAGQLLGSRSYFPTVPAHSTLEEIITAFITQHYLSHPAPVENVPKQIIVDAALSERTLLEHVLSEQAKHKVEVIHPLRGEKKKWLDMATLNAKQSLATHLFAKTNIQERVIALQTALDLKKLPQRIECFDISHTMGEATVASCVVFDQNGPVKSDYRRFNINNITPGDDVAAMHQVLHRRFKRLQKEAVTLPDIVLIDGGMTQLTAAHAVMEELDIKDILLIGVSKGPDRKPGFETLHRLDHAPIHLPADALALHFIQQIRDEAHRFAITGHRQRRDKARRQSTLELIPGIGAKRRRELLRYFGGIQGLAHASLDELVKVPGISRPLAERIFITFHDATI
ncbi:MAG: excinuclease ABC subunit UvrC [Gammaproteobacteria bacterium]|nr:MAG: excinuclease ABC subunit UvrC [Gammaproteobacteria bacterium]